MENKLGLKLDQKVLVDLYDLPTNYKIAIFKGYFPGSTNPYLVEVQQKDFTGKKVMNYLKGVSEEQIEDLEYKSYSEPNKDWVGQYVRPTDGDDVEIIATGWDGNKDVFVELDKDRGTKYHMDFMLKYYKLNNEPFGDIRNN